MSSINFTFISTLLLGGSLLAEAGPLYSIQALGSLGTDAASVSAMNHSGVAAGFQIDQNGNLMAVTAHDGQTTSLSSNALALGINDAGTVVGASLAGWTPTVTEWVGGKQTSLGLTGYGMAINQSGMVAGSYQTGSGGTHAFTRTAAGHVTDWGTLGGSWSSANAITSTGKIAGTSTIGSGALRAFVSNGTSLQNLGTLGGTDSYALALSDNGHYVAGASENAKGYLNAFLWSGSGLHNLGTLGGNTASANGVNDAGWVVGSAATSSSQETGFLYEHGAMFDLNKLLPVASGWTITNAEGIDDFGNILATASRGDQTWAVELMYADPVATPEPGAMALVGAGLIGLASFGRRARKALKT